MELYDEYVEYMEELAPEAETWVQEQIAEELYTRDNSIKSLRARITELQEEIERLRTALLELFEEGEFQHCTSSRECFTVGRVGRGAYETPLDNAAGGRWFSECSCMTDAQRKAADLLDKKT